MPLNQVTHCVCPWSEILGVKLDIICLSNHLCRNTWGETDFQRGAPKSNIVMIDGLHSLHGQVKLQAGDLWGLSLSQFRVGLSNGEATVPGAYKKVLLQSHTESMHTRTYFCALYKFSLSLFLRIVQSPHRSLVPTQNIGVLDIQNTDAYRTYGTQVHI